jgi:protein TonB
MLSNGSGGVWHLLPFLLVALALHVALILGLKFKTAFPDPVEQKRLEITLVRPPVPELPHQAEYLAAENQLGTESKPRSESMTKSAMPEPKPLVGVMRGAAKGKEAAVTKPIRSLSAPRSERVRETPSPPMAEAAPAQITTESLNRQIAEFGAAYLWAQHGMPNLRMVYINSVNAYRYKAAAYEKAWQEKVERIGNLNYPEQARRKNLTGSLVLSVGIRADGTVYKVQVRRSSGQPELDEAAERIVHLAAPFAPFPVELREQADVLVITRTWKFSNGARLETLP